MHKERVVGFPDSFLEIYSAEIMLSQGAEAARLSRAGRKKRTPSTPVANEYIGQLP